MITFEYFPDHLLKQLLKFKPLDIVPLEDMWIVVAEMEESFYGSKRNKVFRVFLDRPPEVVSIRELGEYNEENSVRLRIIDGFIRFETKFLQMIERLYGPINYNAEAPRRVARAVRGVGPGALVGLGEDVVLAVGLGWLPYQVVGEYAGWAFFNRIGHLTEGTSNAYKVNEKRPSCTLIHTGETMTITNESREATIEVSPTAKVCLSQDCLTILILTEEKIHVMDNPLI